MFSHDTHQMPDEFILDYFPSAKIPDFLGYRDLVHDPLRGARSACFADHAVPGFA